MFDTGETFLNVITHANLIKMRFYYKGNRAIVKDLKELIWLVYFEETMGLCGGLIELSDIGWPHIFHKVPYSPLSS